MERYLKGDGPVPGWPAPEVWPVRERLGLLRREAEALIRPVGPAPVGGESTQ
jgi:hypothetical protein